MAHPTSRPLAGSGEDTGYSLLSIAPTLDTTLEDVAVEDLFVPSSRFSAFMTTFRALVGTGILSLPYCLSVLGLACGVGGLVAMALLNLYTTRILVSCVGVARDKLTLAGSYTGRELGYNEVGRVAFNNSAWFVVVAGAATVLNQLGNCCTVVIFITSNVETVLGVNRLVTGGALAVVYVGLAQLRSVGMLWPSSFVGNVTLVAGIATVFYHGFADTVIGPWGAYGDCCRPAGLATFFGLSLFSFSAHAESVSIEQSVRDVRVYHSVLNWVYIVATTLMLTFGVLGYLFYGAATRDIIFLNLPAGSIAVKVVVSFMCATVMFNYPVNMFPAITILENVFLPVDRMKPVWREAARTAVRVVLVLFCTVVSAMFSDFGQFTALVGALCTGLIAFVLPPAMYLSLFKGRLNGFERAVNVVVLLFGVVASTVCSLFVALNLFFGIDLPARIAALWG